jgi:hypothetical protein
MPAVEKIRVAPELHWPILALLAILSLYILANTLLNKNMSIGDYLRQTYHPESHYFGQVLLIGLVFTSLLSLWLWPLLPTLPAWLQDIEVMGYVPNKFGYLLACMASYMIIKHLLCWCFYLCSGSLKRWVPYCFSLHKFYLVFSALVVLLIINQYFLHVEHYFLPKGFDEHRTYGLILVGMFVTKCIFEFFHQEPILPKQWYHKFLYLCTLQILPLLVLAKLLFM